MLKSVNQTLSSFFTFVLKYIFPLFIFILFVDDFILMITDYQTYDKLKDWQSIELLPEVIVLFVYWFVKFFNVKKLSSDGKEYTISNYLTSEKINVDEVLEVSERNFLGTIITITLSRETKFGNVIRIVPQKIPTPDFNKYAMVGIIARLSGLKLTSNFDKAYKPDENQLNPGV